MPTLFDTKYPNNSRVVSGTVQLYRDDVILLCDTSSGAVTINLFDIPENYWNTTYKLYIFDLSGNAATNNITINAPASTLVNQQASLVLNQNNSGAIIRILSNTAYSATLTYNTGGGGGGGYNTVEDEGTPLPQQTVLNFIGEYVAATDGITKTDITINPTIKEVTNAELIALASANNLVKGLNYKITDPIYAETVTVIALEDNYVSLQGHCTWLCADWGTGGRFPSFNGDYSGVAGFVGQLGVWNSSLTPAIGNVVIFNNLHYVNKTGVVGGEPPTDADTWELLPKTDTNGYIRTYYDVHYKPSTNYCLTVWDNLNNIVEYADPKGVISLKHFPFGRSTISNNKITGSETNLSYWNIVDLNVNNNIVNDAYIALDLDPNSLGSITFNDNELRGGAQLGVQGLIPSSNVSIENNFIVQGNCELQNLSALFTGDIRISGNNVRGGQILLGTGGGSTTGTFDITVNNNLLSGDSSRLYVVDLILNNADIDITDNVISNKCQFFIQSISSVDFKGNNLDLEGSFPNIPAVNPFDLTDNNLQGGVNSVLSKELSTFRKVLDMSDPLVYDGATSTLHLGTETWVGEYLLTNSNTGSIQLMDGGQKVFPFKLEPAQSTNEVVDLVFTAVITVVSTGSANNLVNNGSLVNQTRLSYYGEYRDSAIFIRRENTTETGVRDNNWLVSMQKVI